MISYSHRDEDLRRELETHLSLLRRQGVVSTWHDRMIPAGTEWADQINEHLESAGVILLLISPDFLASDYCYETEMTRAIERHESRQARVIPVILRSSDWQSAPFGKLQALPKDGKPVTSWPNHDDAFLDVTRGIRAAIAGLPPPNPLARPPAAASTRPAGENIARVPALPRIWNIPFPPKPSFTGREGLLANLRAALTDGRPQVLHGLGGVGKSQLVVEYAWRHAQDYELVWWMRADEAMSLTSDYADLATKLGLGVQAASDQLTVVKAMHRWLQTEHGWLLIFDDASGPEILDEYLPRQGTGHVVITSRNPDWGEVAQARSVPPLQQAEASAFLRQRAPQAGPAAEVLADELGELPLALEQAAAYMAQTGRTAAEYLAMFRRSRREMLMRPLPVGIVPVATAWKLAFEQVEATAAASSDLLNLCAFLAPEDIFRELLTTGASQLPSTMAALTESTLAWDDAVLILRRYSLVEVTGDAVSINGLVQAVVRDRLADDARISWASTVVRVVNEAFPDNPDQNVQAWPACARLLPHALAVTEHAIAAQSEAETTCKLLYKAGVYLLRRANFSQAETVVQKGLTLSETTYGLTHPEVAAAVTSLGLLRQAQGDLAGARPYLERALAIREDVLGADHADTARSLSNLGSLLCDQDELAGARPYLERALAIREEVLGADHPDTAESLNTVGGLLLLDQTDLVGARPLLERALAICEKVLGADHPDTASSLLLLGALLKAQGDLAGARPCVERALAIYEKVLGADHPDTATSLFLLGILLLTEGDLNGARPYLERTLAVREKVLGPENPATATSLFVLGTLLLTEGDLNGARPYLERTLAVREKVLGPENPATATSLFVLGGLLRDQGDRAGARPYFERALAIREKVLGPENPDTATSLSVLGGLLRDQGDRAAARPYFERALAIREKVLGPENPDTATSLLLLGALLKAQGDLTGARPYLERALAIRDKVLGAEHPDTATSLSNLGFLVQAQGDLARARTYFERALAIDEKVLGPEHAETAIDLNNLGLLLKAQGDLTGARTLIERALAIDQKVLGPEHPTTATILSNLRSLQKAQDGQPR